MIRKRSKVLALLKLLTKYSDEEHPLTMKDILRKMAEEGIQCSHDSISRYMDQLYNELGVDIISGRGRNAAYYIGDRLLGKEELKLIVDAINASTFIEKSISSKIVEKLKSTISVFDEKNLDRTVLGTTITKAENRKILYNVNRIQEAIAEDSQIQFFYLEWKTDKKLHRRREKMYTMSPWALVWAYDRYYAYGYDVKEKDGEYQERNYRVDKMDGIVLTKEKRSGARQFRNFNADAYVSKRIGMFTGKEYEITVEIPKKLLGAFIDQFGKKIVIGDTNKENKLVISFYAVDSPALYGWLFGLGNVSIVSPKIVRNNYYDKISAAYNKAIEEKK